MIIGEFDQNILSCKKCILAATRKNIVVGEGTIPSDIFVLMDAPGRTEDIMGVPAMGKRGLLIRSVLPKKYFLTTTVLCRPPNDRNPTCEEQSKCWTHYLLKICAPKVILAIGDMAYEYLSGYANVVYVPDPINIMYNKRAANQWKKTMLQSLDTR